MGVVLLIATRVDTSPLRRFCLSVPEEVDAHGNSWISYPISARDRGPINGHKKDQAP